MSALPNSTFVPPESRAGKTLTVRLRKGKDRFEAVTGWSEYVINDDGSLTVIRPDRSRKVYASGYWLTIETTVAR